MDPLILHEHPSLDEPQMVLAFTGWMDGGRVSTGTLEVLAQASSARKFAEIDSLEFYIHHFPAPTLPLAILVEGDHTILRSLGAMEQAAQFRPHTEIRDGIIRRLSFARNDLLCSEEANLILFIGEEPHIRWRTYAECLLEVADEYRVRELFFVGSVGGSVPHTRQPRMWSVVSHERMKERREHPDIRYSNYEGPASFVTFFALQAAARGLDLRTLVVEVPHYPFLEISAYPASILRAATVLAEWLHLTLPLRGLRQAAESVRKQLDQIMEENEEFRDLVRKLEEAYDAEEAPLDEHLLRRLFDKLDPQE